MKYLSTIAWVGFILIILFGVCQGYKMRGKNFSIIRIELGSGDEAREYLNYLGTTSVNHHSLLHEAKINTRADCFFILCYVIIMINVSYQQMQREKWYPLNTLLRLSILLAVCTGLCDYIENGCMFYDFHHYYSDHLFISSRYISILKFTLACWIIVVWVTSLIKNLLRSSH
jgi:hypothetical protein